MEEERRRPISLIDYFRHHHAQLDHWFYDEESFVHRDVYSGTASLSSFREVENFSELQEWNKKRLVDVPDRVFFVDGRMRIYGRILLGLEAFLLGEIAAGHAIWEKGKGLSMGFSPHCPPLKRQIIGVSKSMALSWQKYGMETGLELERGMVFFPEDSESGFQGSDHWDPPQQALFNALSKLEKEVVDILLPYSVPIIQDGTVHTQDESFRVGIGPLGLVKRIENFRLPIEGRSLQEETSLLFRGVWDMLFELNKGERTPFFGALLSEQAEIQRVFIYTRLIERDERYPLKGLVRCEVVVHQRETEQLRSQITSFFDQIVSLLPTLTGDYPWRRLPENIFPIIALEDYLGQYFLSPDQVRHSFLRALREEIDINVQPSFGG